MIDREKLVDLIDHVAEGHIVNLMQPGGAEALAGYLITNGVMIQEWRDAKTDPPELKTDVLMLFESGTMAVGFLTDDTGWRSNIDNEWYAYCENDPVKWMPLPELPREKRKCHVYK